jgi:FtsP/CotA-like multicopper oxidase with cupredoxin domain
MKTGGRTRRHVGVTSAAALVFALTIGMQGPSSAAPEPVQKSPALQMFTAPLPIPPEIDARGGGSFGLDELVGTHRFGTLSTGATLGPTPSFGYWPTGMAAPGDVYLGPTIEATRGYPLAMTVTNRLSEPGTDPTAPAVCRALGLRVIHPLATYFDPTIEGTSELDECATATSTHLHGGHTPPASDGGPVDTFRPAGIDPGDYAGGTGAFTYRYPNDQEATELWYHDHALADTRFNPMAGLAGVYLVRDAWDTGRPGNPLGLPANGAFTQVGTDGGLPVLLPENPYEIPLVLQDRLFDADGTLAYPTSETDYHPVWAPESFGDVAVVNGQAWPNLDVDRGLYRFRMVNGSNARFYRLTLVDAKTGNPSPVPVYQIGADGGLFNAPVPISALPGGRLLIAPGERADLLVDFRGAAAGARFRWFNNAPAPYPKGSNDLKPIMQFTVRSAAGFAGPVPTVLRGQPGHPLVPAPAPATASTSRTVFLNEVLDAATDDPVEALLNNLRFMGPDGQMRTTGIVTPKLDTVEEWTIVNTTGDAHPIHLHLTQFQVLDRQKIKSTAYLGAVNPDLPYAFPDHPSAAASGVQGSDGAVAPPDPTPFLIGNPIRPNANETGWKDTVQTYPGQVTRLLVPFGGTAAGLSAAFTGDPVTGPQRFVGTYVWHCHILEHEENDMMQPYRIVP